MHSPAKNNNLKLKFLSNVIEAAFIIVLSLLDSSVPILHIF